MRPENRHKGPRHTAIGCESLEGRRLLSSLATDVGKLAKDAQAIRKGSNISTAEVQAVTADVVTIAAVASKPGASSVAALKSEIKVVIAHGSLTPASTAALQKDALAVLASANVPTPLAQQTVSDVHAVLASSGVTRADVKLILGDVQAVLTDVGSLRK